MSLSVGYNIAKSALVTVSAQTEVVSRNIAGAEEAGYVRRSAYPVTAPGGGAQLFNVTRDQNLLLFASLLNASSSQGARTEISDGLDALQRIYDDPAFGQSPSALVTDLEIRPAALCRCAARRGSGSDRRGPGPRHWPTVSIRQATRSSRCASTPMRRWPRQLTGSTGCLASSKKSTPRSPLRGPRIRRATICSMPATIC